MKKEKHCPKCKNSFPVEEFGLKYDKRTNKYFPGAYCSECAKQKRKESLARRLERDPDYEKKRHKRKYQRRVNEAFKAYGGEKPSCACCGETFRPFLTIDHIDGNGTRHRKNFNAGDIYTWLKRENYPKGFQILCRNCNFAKWSLSCSTEELKQQLENRILNPSLPV